MLPTQTRVLGWNTGSIRRVAASTGGHLAVGNTTAVYAFTQSHQIFFFGETRLAFFACQPIGNVLHVLFIHNVGNSAHYGVGAFARFELLQLLHQIFGVLLG